MVNDAIQDGKRGRLTVVGALGGDYIFKPPSDHFPEMPENEHVTIRIAEAYAINVVKSSLIRLQSGELTLTHEGKKRKLQWKHFARLGAVLGLNNKQINGIATRFQKSKPLALRWINNSFLSEEFKEKYRNLLEERYARLETMDKTRYKKVRIIWIY